MINPGPLSLLELLMITFRVGPLIYVGQVHEWASRFPKTLGHKPIGTVDAGTAKNLQFSVECLSSLGLVSSRRDAEAVVAALADPKTTHEDLRVRMGHLMHSLGNELTSRLFLAIEPERASYYTAAQLFGGLVSDVFPDAITDIEEAGKCLALGRATAAVFHLMRIMEVGLREFAVLLGVPYAPSWESYITQIGTKIQEKHKRKGVRWKKDEPFFRDAMGDLMAIKLAWRNPTMHVRRTYSPEEAEQILGAVRAFMQRMAERLKSA